MRAFSLFLSPCAAKTREGAVFCNRVLFSVQCRRTARAERNGEDEVSRGGEGGGGGKHEKEGRAVHGPRRGGFCACEIVANAYRSRLSFPHRPSRLPFALAVFLCARPSFSTPYACEAVKSGEKKREEREREGRGSERLPSLFPSFSIFPSKEDRYLLSYFYYLIHFVIALRVIAFALEQCNLSVRILLENSFALHYWTGGKKRMWERRIRGNILNHLDHVPILAPATSRRNLLRESMSSASAKTAPEIWYANPPLPDNARYPGGNDATSRIIMIDVWVIYEPSDYANRPFKHSHASLTTLPPLLSYLPFSAFRFQRLKSPFFIYDSTTHCIKCDLSQAPRTASFISRVCLNWAYCAELKEILSAVSGEGLFNDIEYTYSNEEQNGVWR